MAFRVLSQRGGFLRAAHTERGFTGGLTFSEDFRVIRGNLIVHVGLARFSGTVHGPGGATIGIANFTFINDRGRAQTISFGNEDNWETAIYREQVTTFSIGVHVFRAQMKGWFFIQAIDSF